MKRLFSSFLLLFVLSACSQEAYIDEIDDEEEIVVSTADLVIPSVIFTSDKRASTIPEDEMKQSIKTYLDSFQELYNASEPFQAILDEDGEFSKMELEKFNTINKLIKENDANFSNYISNNTLPKGYLEDSKRISQYTTAFNAFLYELDEMLDDVEEGVFPEIDMKSIIGTSRVVNGKEQKKIEDFLAKHNIKTTAFER